VTGTLCPFFNCSNKPTSSKEDNTKAYDYAKILALLSFPVGRRASGVKTSAHADFRDTPTHFVVIIKYMFSTKIFNQNMDV